MCLAYTAHGQMKIFEGLDIVMDAMRIVHTRHIDQLNHSFSSEHLTGMEVDLLGTALSRGSCCLERSIVIFFWVLAGEEAQ